MENSSESSEDEEEETSVVPTAVALNIYREVLEKNPTASYIEILLIIRRDYGMDVVDAITDIYGENYIDHVACLNLHT